MQPAPIDAVLPDIQSALEQHGVVVVQAPPGTGKTTRVPLALADRPGQVWVLEPRRIAARASAEYVASTLNEGVGQQVGYAVRFERKSSASTRVLYVTEALLGRRFIGDPLLNGIHTVVLDEFHERSIHTDLALARTRALREVRTNLRLVVMSATLDGPDLARRLNAPLVTAEARTFPVDIRAFARKDDRALVEQVAAGVEAALHHPGDVLVFLPGRGEITACADRLAKLAGVHAFDIVPLHGDLDGNAQVEALRPGKRRRVLLATNVAETSVTAPGVGVVVDTGLARIAGHDPWTGQPTLSLQPIPRASADQRAGRAGRTGPGTCFRLYHDYAQRPFALLPELARADLAAVRLETWGQNLPWLDAPPAQAWDAAATLLTRLGAVEAERTAVGEAMLNLPVAPRLARVLLEAAALGYAQAGATLVARLGERIRKVEDPVASRDAPLGPEAQKERRQLLAGLHEGEPQMPEARALQHALLAGFPDRLGQRKGARVVFSEGKSAVLEPGSPGADGIVVVSDVERIGAETRVRRLSAVPEDWVLERAEVRSHLRWNGTRVDVLEQLVYGDLVLDEGVGGGDVLDIARVLEANIKNQAHRIFSDWEQAEQLAARVRFLRRVGVELPELTLPELVSRACVGCASIRELEDLSLCAVARTTHDLAYIERLAPAAIPLGNRNRVVICYPDDQDPFLASRMQDFFGLARGPVLAGNRPLVLHLLAPNQRAVQITTDLAGFWKVHWPSIRKELMRRYPRHLWPEDPLIAEPPPERRR